MGKEGESPEQDSINWGGLLSRLELDAPSKKVLSQAVRVHPRTVDRWLSGETTPNPGNRDRLVTLAQVNQRLRDTFETEEGVEAWLGSPNRYLKGTTPLEAIKMGRVDRVNSALEALDSGAFV